jgi:hypothetical protein
VKVECAQVKCRNWRLKLRSEAKYIFSLWINLPLFWICPGDICECRDLHNQSLYVAANFREGCGPASFRKAFSLSLETGISPSWSLTKLSRIREEFWSCLPTRVDVTFSWQDDQLPHEATPFLFPDSLWHAISKKKTGPSSFTLCAVEISPLCDLMDCRFHSLARGHQLFLSFCVWTWAWSDQFGDSNHWQNAAVTVGSVNLCFACLPSQFLRIEGLIRAWLREKYSHSYGP